MNIGIGISPSLSSNPAGLAGLMASLGWTAWWRMSSTADATGKGHTLTLTNAPSQSATGLVLGDPDTATSLNGTSQFASFADATDLRFVNGDSFSLVALVKPTAVTSTREVVGKGRVSGGNQGNWQLRNNAGALEFYYVSSGPTFNIWTSTSTSIFAVGTNVHIAITWAVGSAAPTVYVNGSAITGSVTSGAFTNAPSANTDSGEIGAVQAAGSFFAGTIDEVAVGRFILTAAQVAALAAFKA